MRKLKSDLKSGDWERMYKVNFTKIHKLPNSVSSYRISIKQNKRMSFPKSYITALLNTNKSATTKIREQR